MSFLSLALVIGLGFAYVRSQATEASGRPPIPNTTVAQLAVELRDGGGALINGERYHGLVSFEPRGDVFYLQAYDADGAFVNQLSVSVTYPRDVQPSQVIARHFASFGVQLSEPEIISSRQVVFTAFGLQPTSTYRVELVLPEGTIQPSLVRQMIDGARTLPLPVWTAIAVAMPVLATFVLLGMLAAARRTWRAPATKKERAEPPADLPPAVVGVLMQGRVSPRSLAATLLHLATRGYLVVTHRQSGFAFTKRPVVDSVRDETGHVSSPTLNRFEEILLDKMFLPESDKATMADIQLRIGRHVYSRKVAEVYLEMYQGAVDQGWFVRDPQAIYRRFRALSLGVIVGSVLGFLVSLAFGPEPFTYLLGWAGLFFVGIVMYRITPFLPRRTNGGDAAYAEWAAFRTFLMNQQPLGNVSEPQKLYQRFLPYAVIMGVEVEWTERFRQLPFKTPEWYVAVEDIERIEDFANSLFPFIGTVASDLSKTREPHAI